MGFETAPLDVPTSLEDDLCTRIANGDIPDWLEATGVGGTPGEEQAFIEDVRETGPPAVARFSILDSAPEAIHSAVSSFTPPAELPPEGGFFRGFEATVRVTANGDIEEVELAAVYQD